MSPRSGSRQPRQGMGDGKDGLSYDIILKLHQKIIHLSHRPGSGILDGKHRVIRRSFFNGVHGVPEGPHVEAVAVLAKIRLHGRLTVSSFRPLEYDPCIFLIQRIDLDKGKPAKGSRLDQLLILKLPAHGHQLLVQFLYPFFIKICGDLCRHIRQLLPLPLPVEDLGAGAHLVFSHRLAELHPLFIKPYDLIVHLIQLCS